jgi:hypothetical protein
VRDSQKINCHVHGPQEEAFVCQHIAQSLRTGIPNGFHLDQRAQDYTVKK